MSNVPAIDRTTMRRNFSLHAGEYDRYARVQKRVAGRVVELAAEAGFPPGRVIDIGTGTGELALRFKQRYPDRPMIVCDVAHPMTCAAHRALPQALAIDGDAHQLPLVDGSVSLVLSSSVFQWVDDLQRVFDECARILVPGGWFAFALFGGQTLWQLRETYQLARSRSEVSTPDHFHVFPTLDQVSRNLHAAGFQEVACFSEEEREYHPGLRELLFSLKQIGAQNASSRRPRGLFPRKVMLEMSALYGERFSEKEGLPASYEVIYASGRIPA